LIHFASGNIGADGDISSTLLQGILGQLMTLAVLAAFVVTYS